MTTDQFARFLEMMEQLINRQYTISGAADWPILLVIGTMLLAAIGAMWADLKAALRDNRREWKEALHDAKSENEKDHDIIWDAIRDCQNECCPRKK